MDTTALTHGLNRARAMHELQLQVGFALKDGERILGFAYPAEFLTEELWEKCKAHAPELFISSARATVLGMGHAAGGAAIAGGELSFDALMNLIAGQADTSPPPLTASELAGPLVMLAKQAGILPAIIWMPSLPPFADSLFLDKAALFSASPTEIIPGERVMLPIDGAEHSTITSYHLRYDAGVHLALTIGTPGAVPLVRVHSSCVTGDMLGSLRCDCGGQLHSAIAAMKEQGGILLYLHQEGRGIGITSKLRAYALQECGFDTFSANQQLGFEEDERDFSIASAILKTMGHSHIRLLTNNPDKLSAFTDAGITVTERVPLNVASSPHNHAYIEAKKIKRGHF